MTTVPILGNEAPQRVQVQAFSGQQNIQTNPAMFGGGSTQLAQAGAKTLNAVAEVGENVFLRRQAEADETALLEAEASYDFWKNSFLNGPGFGLLKQKGKDTENSALNAQQAFDSYAATLQKRYAGNPRITNSLQKYFQAQRRALTGIATAHEEKHMEVYRDGLYKAKVERSVETAVQHSMTYYSNVAREGESDATNYIHSEKAKRLTRQAMREGHNTIRRNGKRKGMSGDQIAAEIEAYNDRMVEGVVQNMLAEGNDRQASEFYKDHTDLITNEKVRASIVKSLEEGSTRGESQRQADEIMKDPNLKTNAQKRDRARNIEDSKVRDETIIRIIKRIGEIETDRKLADADKFDAASKWLAQRNPEEWEDGHDPNLPPGAARSFNDLPSKMKPSDARLLTALRTQRPDFDHDAYDSVMDMRNEWMRGGENGWLGKEGQTAIKLLRGKIDDATWKSLDAMQRGDGKPTQRGTNAREDVWRNRENNSHQAAIKRGDTLVKQLVPLPVTSKTRSKTYTKAKTKQTNALAQVKARLQGQVTAWYANEANAGKILPANQIDNWVFESLVEGEWVYPDPVWYNRSRTDSDEMRFVEYTDVSMGRGHFSVTPKGHDEMARLLGVSEQAVKQYAEQIKAAGRPTTIEMIRAAHRLATGQ